MDNDILIKTLIKQRNEIKDKIDNYQKYNQINRIKRKIIKVGIAIDYAFPFILSLIIILNINKKTNNTPFIIDHKEEKEKIELIDTSNKLHEENTYYGENRNPKIEYSEGWKKNEYGLYERKITSYMIHNIDINDKEKIFSMSKEELDSSLIKLNEDIYTKTTLDEEDKKYLENTIIITRIIETNNTRTIKETKEENAFSTMFYIVLFFIIERGIKHINKIIISDKIKTKLNEIEYTYREIDEEKIKELKKILDIREDNLNIMKIRRKECSYGKCIR